MVLGLNLSLVSANNLPGELMMRPLRIVLGLAFWCALAAAVWKASWGHQQYHDRTGRWAEQMLEYSAGTRSELDLQFPSERELAIGDPIFVQASDGSLRQVGRVSALRQNSQPISARQARVREARAELYPAAGSLSSSAELTYFATPDSLGWIVETLLPLHKRTQIAGEINAVYQTHQQEIVAALRPVAEQSVRDSLAVIEADLPPALARHRPELEAIAARYHQDIVEAEVIPLVQEEVWPIVRRHGEPVAVEIGSDLWARVSLWRIGWRYAYDRSPLPEKRLAEKEFQRFADEEAAPILQQHSDEILAAIGNSLKDTARNPRVRAALRRNLVRIMEDPELQAVLGTVFREVIVDNPRLREVIERNWSSPQAQAALQVTANRFEPTVRRLGDLVFGTPEEGISPEFAAVLRNQILHKDRRWLLLRNSASASAMPAQPHTVQVTFPSRDVLLSFTGAETKRGSAE